MTQRQQTDSWKATVHRQLETVQASILDLIDVGPDPAPAEIRCPGCRDTESGRCHRFPSCRWPAKHIRAAMDRHLEHDPPVRGRAAGVYTDPTLGTVQAWEAEVQQTTHLLYEVVSAALTVAAAPGVTPIDDQGRELAPPNEPGMVEEPEGSGKWRLRAPVAVTVDPVDRRTWRADCRRAALGGVRYVAATVDAVTEVMWSGDPDQRERARSHAGWLALSVGRLARRLDRDPVELADDRLCGCQGEACAHGPGSCSNVSDRHLECRSCRRRRAQAS